MHLIKIRRKFTKVLLLQGYLPDFSIKMYEIL